MQRHNQDAHISERLSRVAAVSLFIEAGYIFVGPLVPSASLDSSGTSDFAVVDLYCALFTTISSIRALSI